MHSIIYSDENYIYTLGCVCVSAIRNLLCQPKAAKHGLTHVPLNHYLQC